MHFLLKKPKDRAIFAFDGPFYKITNVAWAAQGVTPERTLTVWFRYSLDNKYKISEWLPVEKISEVVNQKLLWVQLKFETGGVSDHEIILTEIIIEGEPAPEKEVLPTITCTECVSNGNYLTTKQCIGGVKTVSGQLQAPCNSYNPYDVGCAVDIWRNLNSLINQRYGIDVYFWQAQQHENSSDVILKEFGIYQASERHCLKIMIDGNIFPETNYDFSGFGMNYQNGFEVLIEYQYFKNLFGANVEPHKRDFIYIPIANRMYMISSVTLFRSFMNYPAWWKVDLTKYTDNVNVIKPADVKEFLDEKLVYASEVLEPATEEEIIDVSLQHQVETTAFSHYRSYVSPSVKINDDGLNNNFTFISEHTYDFSPAYREKQSDILAVQYVTPARLAADENMMFSAWFKRPSVEYKTNVMVARFIKDVRVDLATGKLLVEFKSPHKFETGKFVQLSGLDKVNGFYRVEKFNDYIIRLPGDFAAVPMPVINSNSMVEIEHAVNLIDGYDYVSEQGLRLDVFGSRYFNLTINKLQYRYDIGIELPVDFWLAVVLNINNYSKQLSLNIYRKSAYDTANPNTQSTELERVAKFVDTLSTFNFNLQDNWGIEATPVRMTSIRMMKECMEEELHSLFLTSAIVKDAHKAHFLDNAEHVHNKPKVGKNQI